MKLPKELKEKIHVWAEGSDNLEKLLTICHEHDLKTAFCCKGHKEKNMIPYLGIYFDINKKELIKLLALATLSKNNAGLGFSLYNKDERVFFYNLDFKEFIDIINNKTNEKEIFKKNEENKKNIEEKIIDICLNNQNFNNRISMKLFKENIYIIILAYTETEEFIHKFNFDKHSEKIKKLPNIDIYSDVMNINQENYYTNRYTFQFSTIEELYNFIVEYENELFNK